VGFGWVVFLAGWAVLCGSWLMCVVLMVGMLKLLIMKIIIEVLLC